VSRACRLAIVLVLIGALPLSAQGVRDRTRPSGVRDASVSDAQAVELTLTVIEVARRPLQTWVRVAGSLDASGRTLVAYVSSAEASILRPGQRARVFPPQSKASMTQGRVSRVIEDGDRTRVELSLPVEPSYRAARYVMEIVAERGRFLAVSNEAIIEEGDQQIVYLAQGQGHYVPREIRTGLRGELFTEVVEGLVAGDRVVTFGSFFIDAEYKLKLAAPVGPRDAHQDH